MGVIQGYSRESVATAMRLGGLSGNPDIPRNDQYDRWLAYKKVTRCSLRFSFLIRGKA